MNFQEEYIKCLQDKTRQYFIENYLTTFNATEGKETPFRLFPRQIAFLNSLAYHNNTVAIKPRQAGITTVSAAWLTGQIVFASKKSPETILCIGNKLDISEQLLEKMTNFLDQVPRWMWGSDFYSPDPDSLKNTKSIYKKRNKNHVELFNGCKIYARSSGENASRGVSSVSALILDEAAFIQNAMGVYTSAVAATSSYGDKARIIMVSTPNGKDPLYYHTYTQALNKKNNYNCVEFRWYQDPRYNRFLEWYRTDKETNEIEWNRDTVINKKGNVEYNEERWRNLEREGWKPTSPWYKDMCKSFNNDAQKIAQELDVSFLGSADNVISPDIIEAQRRQNVIEITDDWELKDNLSNDTWIWKDPIPGHRYVCSCDPSSGAGNDSTSIQVIDMDAIDENGTPFFEQVLEYSGKMMGDEIGSLLYRYGEMYNNALVVVEGIGGYGDAAILQLMAMKYPNLYFDDPGLKTYTVKQDYIKFGKRADGKLPGFRTNGVRSQMLANLVNLIKSNAFRIRSVRVISELETWVWKNGRPDHQEGAHDDNLTCLAMGLFVLEFSMLKSEKQKAKDSSMLRSWKANNSSNNKTYDEPSLRNSVKMNPSSMKINPFVNDYKRKERKHMSGCLMLGGFFSVKKN